LFVYEEVRQHRIAIKGYYGRNGAKWLPTHVQS